MKIVCIGMNYADHIKEMGRGIGGEWGEKSSRERTAKLGKELSGEFGGKGGEKIGGEWGEKFNGERTVKLGEELSGEFGGEGGEKIGGEWNEKFNGERIAKLGEELSGELSGKFGGKAPVEPVFFMKPDTALLRNNEAFYIPDFSDEIHYECEIVVRINRVTKAIEERFAHRCYDEIGLGIDFTARDLQQRCKTKGLPWEIAKAFDHSAAVSPVFIKKTDLSNNLNFNLKINGELRQQGCADDMIFSIDQIISYVSRYTTLKIGDLIFTGTPSGTGKVSPGDHLTASLEGRILLDFDIK